MTESAGVDCSDWNPVPGADDVVVLVQLSPSAEGTDVVRPGLYQVTIARDTLGRPAYANVVQRHGPNGFIGKLRTSDARVVVAQMVQFFGPESPYAKLGYGSTRPRLGGPAET